MAALEKPESVARDPVKSAKWDELTAGRRFKASDAPTLALLCQWHAVVARCMDDIDNFDGLVFENDVGDLKALPQLNTMKQASAEIRQLNKQLGINDEARGEAERGGASIVSILAGNRAERIARASAAG